MQPDAASARLLPRSSAGRNSTTRYNRRGTSEWENYAPLDSVKIDDLPPPVVAGVPILCSCASFSLCALCCSTLGSPSSEFEFRVGDEANAMRMTRAPQGSHRWATLAVLPRSLGRCCPPAPWCRLVRSVWRFRRGQASASARIEIPRDESERTSTQPDSHRTRTTHTAHTYEHLHQPQRARRPRLSRLSSSGGCARGFGLSAARRFQTRERERESDKHEEAQAAAA
jgi:hypothetical protein